MNFKHFFKFRAKGSPPRKNKKETVPSPPSTNLDLAGREDKGTTFVLNPQTLLSPMKIPVFLKETTPTRTLRHIGSRQKT
jgi:hypothetical protein